ncbi:MAG: universal stress protein [Candidatus Thermoplasmatota archaeon]|jgi:nucleotide-binding universal stress UspA family protein|nr:universal stress protein [Candidatus Thermoplasmatota archaeon]
MKKILVGFDGSFGSKQALNRAMTLIEEDGELILLSVIPGRLNKIFVDENIHHDLKQKAELMLSDVINSIGQHKYNVKPLVEEGDPASVIIDVANKLNVDLIVLGSKGTSAIGQYLLGSVANKVVQYAYKPVMVVR